MASIKGFDKDSKKVLEAALFMSPKAVPIEELAKTIKNDSLLETHRLVKELLEEFNQRDSALEITDLNGSFQMRVRDDFEGDVQKFASGAEFNKSIQKTLALIAFKQPIKQSLVIKLRNNKGYEHVKVLFEKGLISKTRYGRTFLLKTTKKFLEQFGKNALKSETETEAKEIGKAMTQATANFDDSHLDEK
ncbi:SMC-Scp complex subunit ScpB [Candidatus Micrarchaeota archaeon]|nr:SMC-Scp complex subunit ScpB [Candidatus Micrarchaeota archaeon]MBU1931018.1 SMC-Scp complex subunit ScpB [Candidatus Micrarchaeota archaeon]